MRYLLILYLLVPLSACGHVPVTSLLKLSSVDLLTIDPANISVAVLMPPGVRVRENGSKLAISSKNTGDSSLDRNQEFVLAGTDFSAGVPGHHGLPTPAGGQSLSLFMIAGEDLVRMRLLQREIAGQKARNPDAVKGALSVSAAGCLTGSLPNGPLPVTTFMRTARSEPFIVLTRAIDLKSVIPPEKIASELPLCEKP